MLDVLKACWILFVFLLIFFGLASRLFAKRPNTAIIIRIAGNFARMTLCVTAAVFAVANIKALTAITMLLLLAGALTAAWMRKHNWKTSNLVQDMQSGALRFIRKAESWSFGAYLVPRMKKGVTITLPRIFTVHHWLDFFENQGVLAVVFLAIVLMSSILFSRNALHGLRFDHPEEYSNLLRGRELVLNLRAIGLPFVFPAMAATTSLIGATDLMQVTRFLFPVIEIFLVLAAGLAIRACTRSGVAAIATMYCLGAAAFPPLREAVPGAQTALDKLLGIFDYTPVATRPGPELLLGLIFMLLALVFLADWQRNPDTQSLVDVGCCLVLVGIVSQFLLILLVAAAAALLVMRPLPALMIFSVLCYALATVAIFSNGPSIVPYEIFRFLPLAAAIAMGCAIEWIRAALSVAAGKHAEGIVFIGFLVLVVVWLRPHGFAPQFLEYEISARQTQAIIDQFPRQKWAVVAPVEQLPETFGFGGYEDLAAFIAEFDDNVSNPNFRFPHAPDHLFVYVEKRPYQMFAHEPTSVSFETLTDTTFRNYRSPAGRASLETAALRFCETYRLAHSNMSVYFENDDLRIYRIQAEAEPKK